MAEENLKRHDVAVVRIIWAGVAWFAAVVLAIALFLAPLLASGWRPTTLSLPLAIVWWIGAAGVAASCAFIGWSGCPILAENTATEDRRKSKTLPIGMVCFLIGSAACIFAVLLS